MSISAPAILLGTLVPWEYVRKYTQLEEDPGDRSLLGVLLATPDRFVLSSYARYQCFDVDGFFRQLGHRYLPAYLAGCAIYAADFICTGEWQGLLGMLLVLGYVLVFDAMSGLMFLAVQNTRLHIGPINLRVVVFVVNKLTISSIENQI